MNIKQKIREFLGITEVQEILLSINQKLESLDMEEIIWLRKNIFVMKRAVEKLPKEIVVKNVLKVP